MESVSKWNADHKYIYTEHEIKVTRVFKGNIRENTVFLITPGGITDTEFMFVSHSLELTKNTQGLFFAKEDFFDGMERENLNDQTHFAKELNNFLPKQFDDSLNEHGFGALSAKINYDRIINILGEPILTFPDEGSDSPFEVDCKKLEVET